MIHGVETGIIKGASGLFRNGQTHARQYTSPVDFQGFYTLGSLEVGFNEGEGAGEKREKKAYEK